MVDGGDDEAGVLDVLLEGLELGVQVLKAGGSAKRLHLPTELRHRFQFLRRVGDRKKHQLAVVQGRDE
eukprot:8079059-Alexandrium_andersonii.AAC.1